MSDRLLRLPYLKGDTMRNFYQTYQITVPANTLLLIPCIASRPGALPFITCIGRSTGDNSDFLFFVNDAQVIDIPKELSMGYGDFIPFFYQMKENDVTRGGFRNRVAAEKDFFFTIQYFYPE